MDRFKQTLAAYICGPAHFFVVLRFDQPRRRENTDLVKTWRDKKR
jgi:hypothetical protein